MWSVAADINDTPVVEILMKHLTEHLAEALSDKLSDLPFSCVEKFPKYFDKEVPVCCVCVCLCVCVYT
jgi:hypothetical protein